MKPSTAILRKATDFLLEVAEEPVPTPDHAHARAAAAEDLAKKLAPRRRLRKVLSFRSRQEEKEKKRLSRKKHRAEVRAACVARAAGVCECGCGSRFANFGDLTPEWDHFYGKKFESIEETWLITRGCHRAKTENDPDRATWDGKFKVHCAHHGYPFRRRLQHNPLRRAR